MAHQYENVGKLMVWIDGFKLLGCLADIPRKVVSSRIAADLLTYFAWVDVSRNVEDPIIPGRFQFTVSDQFPALEQLEVGRLTPTTLFLVNGSRTS